MTAIQLYVKQHNITGLKYFGMTTRKDPVKYLGSGLYWRAHLRKHGKDITTLEIWKFETQADATKFAIQFSEDNDIVTSKAWANMVVEHAVSGLPRGFKHSEESKSKMSLSSRGNQHHRGCTHSQETKQLMSALKKGKPLSAHHRSKISSARKEYFTDEKRLAQSIRQKESGQSRGANNAQYGKSWMTNGSHTICVAPSKIQALIDEGYYRGRTINKSL